MSRWRSRASRPDVAAQSITLAQSLPPALLEVLRNVEGEIDDELNGRTRRATRGGSDGSKSPRRGSGDAIPDASGSQSPRLRRGRGGRLGANSGSLPPLSPNMFNSEPAPRTEQQQQLITPRRATSGLSNGLAGMKGLTEISEGVDDRRDSFDSKADAINNRLKSIRQQFLEEAEKDGTMDVMHSICY